MQPQWVISDTLVNRTGLAPVRSLTLLATYPVPLAPAAPSLNGH